MVEAQIVRLVLFMGRDWMYYLTERTMNVCRSRGTQLTDDALLFIRCALHWTQIW